MSEEMFCPKCTQTFGLGIDYCPNDGTRLHQLTEDDLCGTTLDEKYVVKRRLGEGGMGVVYLAEHKMLCKEVALKVIRRELIVGKTGIKRFLTEARATASLSSPNTVVLYDFGVGKEGVVYYTMELLRGISLAKHLKECGRVPWFEATKIVRQVCNSLEEAHEKGIIHRDIKPDNIFLTTRKGETAVKVLDFGLAKLISGGTSETLTKTGTICGTPLYLSPEQAQGKAAGPASDLYSLGIVLFEMLAGKPPYTGDTPMGVLRQHMLSQPPAMGEIARDVPVPPSLDAALSKALAKAPEDRFQSAADFSSALSTLRREDSSSQETREISYVSTYSGGVQSVTTAYESSESEQREIAIAGTLVASNDGEASAPDNSPANAPATVGPNESSLEAYVDSHERPDSFLESGRNKLLILAMALVGVAALLWGIAYFKSEKKGGRISLAEQVSDIVAEGDSAPAIIGAPDFELGSTPGGSVGTSPGGTTSDFRPPSSPADLIGMDELSFFPDSGGTDPAENTPEGHLNDDAEMVVIERGVYPIGCHPDDHGCFDDEKATLADMKSFAIDILEVTVADYAGCVAAGRCPLPGSEAECNSGKANRHDHPINCIDWTAGAAFCSFKGKRLPSSTEWEVAARGRAHPDFPWGDEPPTCARSAVGGGENQDCGLGSTLPVAHRPEDRSWCGALDMGGNVREWTSDAYIGDTQGQTDQRINKGGSWQMAKGQVFTAHTIGADSFSVQRPDMGIRCSVSVDKVDDEKK
jgi:serine/threonine protein kinase/formylglycine-generating enzyme required for sulfatase activity